MRVTFLLLTLLISSCQWRGTKSDQSSEIVRQSSKREKITTLKSEGTEEGIVSIRMDNKVKLQGYKGELRGRVLKGDHSYLHVYKMTDVEVEGRKRLRVQFSVSGPKLLLRIKKRLKNGKIKVETVVTINNKSVKASLYVYEGKKDWDVSLGRYLLEHNYKVIGRIK